MSTQTAPPRTACGTSSRLRRGADREEAEIEIAGGEHLRRRLLDRCPAELLPRGARGGEQAHVVVAALAQELQRDRSDRAGGADDADARVASQARTPRGGAERPCRRRVEGTWHAILIGEVETIDASIPACLERRERLRGDARVALHSGADEADLAEVVARGPRDAERVERAGGVGAILDRGGEDDLGVRLHDRVDVHGGLGERAEEPRGRGALDAVDGLLALVHDAGDQCLLEHLFVLLLDPRAVPFFEGRTDVEPHIVTTRDLDRAGGHHAGARRTPSRASRRS